MTNTPERLWDAAPPAGEAAEEDLVLTLEEEVGALRTEVARLELELRRVAGLEGALEAADLLATAVRSLIQRVDAGEVGRELERVARLKAALMSYELGRGEEGRP